MTIKYRVEKIPLKFKEMFDETDLIDIALKRPRKIVSIFDQEDLENKLNEFGKLGWELISSDYKTDYESEVVNTKIVEKPTYGSDKNLPIEGDYEANIYKSINYNYLLCIFKKT